jgi:hypothetical protein
MREKIFMYEKRQKITQLMELTHKPNQGDSHWTCNHLQDLLQNYDVVYKVFNKTYIITIHIMSTLDLLLSFSLSQINQFLNSVGQNLHFLKRNNLLHARSTQRMSQKYSNTLHNSTILLSYFSDHVLFISLQNCNHSIKLIQCNLSTKSQVVTVSSSEINRNVRN